MYIPNRTIVRCGECGSTHIARKILQFGTPDTPGPLVCLDCGHTEKRPKSILERHSYVSKNFDDLRIITF